jgi:hypothetical protein
MALTSRMMPRVSPPRFLALVVRDLRRLCPGSDQSLSSCSVIEAALAQNDPLCFRCICFSTTTTLGLSVQRWWRC